jgi:SAM-dependent methyltransferase
MSTKVISSDQRPEGWSDGAAAYDEWFAPVSSRFAVNALRLLGLEPGQRLLDVAAGTGALTLQAAAAGVHVVAVDFAPGMVGILRRRLGDAGLRADVEQMDERSLGCSSASFDAACSRIEAYTEWPTWRRVSAVSRPKPLLAPVIRIVLDIAGFLCVFVAVTAVVPGGRARRGPVARRRRGRRAGPGSRRS